MGGAECLWRIKTGWNLAQKHPRLQSLPTIHFHALLYNLHIFEIYLRFTHLNILTSLEIKSKQNYIKQYYSASRIYENYVLDVKEPKSLFYELVDHHEPPNIIIFERLIHLLIESISIFYIKIKLWLFHQ